MNDKKIFQTESIREIVKKIGVGELVEFRKEQDSYIGCTPFHFFGKRNPKNGRRNNIAFYIEGESINAVDKLSVILNIENPEDKIEGLSYLDLIVDSLHETIGINYDIEVKNAIRDYQDFEHDFIKIETFKASNIDVIKFVISN